MATVSDVRKLATSIAQDYTLFGFNDERAREEYEEKASKLGRAICEQAGVQHGTRAGHNIPNDLVLGDEADRLFKDLEAWYSQKT